MRDDNSEALLAMVCEPIAAPKTPAPPADPRVGTTLKGHYKIESVLGKGGMGAVYLAHDTHLDRRVAVKVVEPAMTQGQPPWLAKAQLAGFIARFDREARAGARIAHANVVRVHSFEKCDGDDHALVMEYVDGQSLDKVIAERGGLSYEEAVNAAGQVLEGLSAIHKAGIVHRDIKPGNVILTRVDGRLTAKILDLGLSKIADETPSDKDAAGTAETALTQQHAFMGSPKYAAPEQARDTAGVDARADLYSVGVVLFEMVVGRPPFDGKDTTSIVTKHQRDPVPPMHQLMTGRFIPADLEAFVKKAMEKDPAGRFQSAAEMRKTLLAVRLGEAEYQRRPPPRLLKRPTARPAAHQRRYGLMAAIVLAAGAIVWFGGPVIGKALNDRPAAGAPDTQGPDRQASEVAAPVPTAETPAVIETPAETPATAEHGCQLAESAKFDAAARELERVVAANPKDAEAWYCLAKASSRSKALDRAAEAYRRFLALKPKDRIKARRATEWLERNGGK